jgi:hypothetical protein
MWASQEKAPPEGGLSNREEVCSVSGSVRPFYGSLCRPVACRALALFQAVRRRRRHQPRRPPLAKISPGTPAPTMGPGTATVSPNRICATSANPTVLVNATREISSPPAVVRAKKFCPAPLRGSRNVNEAPNWSKVLMFAEPLAVASRLKTA